MYNNVVFVVLFCLVPKEFHGSLKFSPGKNTNSFSSKARARILKCSAEAAAKPFDDKVVLYCSSIQTGNRLLWLDDVSLKIHLISTDW